MKYRKRKRNIQWQSPASRLLREFAVLGREIREDKRRAAKLKRSTSKAPIAESRQMLGKDEAAVSRSSNAKVVD
ncbi:MAG: hypothetical protein IH984_09550 [Planctomycetes bacterium]|nr:hypothetical protein [Planctomycetota bacterium]